jgi:DNA-binding SARP family transcriptional activator
MPDSGLLQYRLLGPLEISHGDRRVAIPPGLAGTIITLLLIRPGTYLRAPELAALLRTSTPVVHNAICALRKAFAAADFELPVPRRARAGYGMEIEPGQLDVNRFRELLGSARDAADRGDPQAALQHLDEALSLWRGGELPVGFDCPGFADDAARDLRALRLEAGLEWCDINLRTDRPWRALHELRRLARENPLSQPVTEKLVLAEARTLGQGVALGTCKEFRDRMADQLGSAPGPGFSRLQEQIFLGLPDSEKAATAGRG